MRSPARCTPPSSNVETLSSSPIVFIDFSVSRYCITEVREMTLNAEIFASRVSRSSCMPSTKKISASVPGKSSSASLRSRVRSLVGNARNHNIFKGLSAHESPRVGSSELARRIQTAVTNSYLTSGARVPYPCARNRSSGNNRHRHA